MKGIVKLLIVAQVAWIIPLLYYWSVLGQTTVTQHQHTVTRSPEKDNHENPTTKKQPGTTFSTAKYHQSVKQHTISVTHSPKHHQRTDSPKQHQQTRSQQQQHVKPTATTREKAVALTCRNRIELNSVYWLTDVGWQHNDKLCHICHEFLIVTMTTQFGRTPIFIHDPKNDHDISANLLKYGMYEGKENNEIYAILQSDPTIDFIDIGANIGVHSLSVARLGRKVLCVEALHLNAQRLCASVIAGGFQDNVTIVYNAISDGHTRVKLGVHHANMGGTFVDMDSAHTKQLKFGSRHAVSTSYDGYVDTVTMDDLVNIPVFKQFSKVVVKMDIEGFEHRAIATSGQFFRALDIRGFLMEWLFHRRRTSGIQIIKRMVGLGFIPYSLGKLSQRLSLHVSDAWPDNVLWRPDSLGVAG